MRLARYGNEGLFGLRVGRERRDGNKRQRAEQDTPLVHGVHFSGT